MEPAVDRAQFTALANRLGGVPMGWVAASERQPWSNLGDVLSPVMVAALSGRRIIRRHFDSPVERLACVGTIGHNFSGSTVHFWGTGMSWRRSPDPSSPTWSPPSGTTFRIHALRGPRTGSLLSSHGITHPGIYGDPVFLLPRFHRPSIKPTHELGVIVHISALAGRHPKEPPLAAHLSYRIDDEHLKVVRVFSMLCEPTLEHVEARLADILSCRRILTTSLHGAVIAEAYGIPWLYFKTSGSGLGEIDLTAADPGLEWRFHDAFAGLGMSRFPYYGQPRNKLTNWDDAIRSIDHAWQPSTWKADDLLAAFPLPLDPRIAAGQQLQLFRDPIFRQTLDDFTSSQFLVPALDAPNYNNLGAPAHIVVPPPPEQTSVPVSVRISTTPTTAADAFRRYCRDLGKVPLAWAACTREAPHANLGDSLNPVIMAALTGSSVIQMHFDSREPRLAAIGSIAHHFRHGEVHLWGTGMNAWANPSDPDSAPYERPPGTSILAHAVRGPQSGDALRRAGVWVSGVWGDPVWLLPRLYRPRIEKCWELGVIVHLSELAHRDPDAPTKPAFQRYVIPPDLLGSVRIISTITTPTLAGLRAKVDEILACRRILTTSLHGLIISECYNIPSLYWKTVGSGAHIADLRTHDRVDHRFRDAWLGIGRQHLPFVATERRQAAPWTDLIRDIDRLWEPTAWRGCDDLLAALPIDLRPDLDRLPDDHLWSVPVTTF